MDDEWSAADVDFLRANWGRGVRQKVLAAELKRCRGVIIRKAKRLGLGPNKPSLPPQMEPGIRLMRLMAENGGNFEAAARMAKKQIWEKAKRDADELDWAAKVLKRHGIALVSADNSVPPR